MPMSVPMSRTELIAALSAEALHKTKQGVCPVCGTPFSGAKKPRHTCGSRHCSTLLQSCSYEARWGASGAGRTGRLPGFRSSGFGSSGFGSSGSGSSGFGSPAPLAANQPDGSDLAPWLANHGDGHFRQPDPGWGF